MNKIYTTVNPFALLAFIFCLTTFATANLEAKTLPFINRSELVLGEGEPIPGDSLAAQNLSEEVELISVTSPDGHLKCIIRKTVFCATKTVKLESLTQALLGGNQITAITVQWNSGQFANQIIVQPPGQWSYDDSSFGCDHHENSIDIPEAFFDGPMTITGPNILCAGDDGVLVVSMPNDPGYDFPEVTWTPENPSGQLSPFLIPGQGTYTLSTIDQFDCPFMATKTVQQSPPVLPTIQGAIFMCSENDSEVLSVSPTFTTYQWQGGQLTQTVTVTEPGTYSVTVTNIYGCTGEREWQVNPADIDTIYGTISAPAICPGTPSTLQVVGGPYSSLVWSNGLVGPTIMVNQPGTYSVTATNPYGCTNARQFVVNPAPQPAPALNSPSICAGASAILSVGGGSFATFNWTGGSNSSTLSVSTPGTYSVTVGDGTGCTGTATTTVQASPAAVPTISGQAAVCSPGTAVFQASGGFSSYAWTTPGGGSGGSSPSIQVDQTGNYIVTVSNSAGCTGTASQAFLVNPSPTPAVSLAPYNCNGQFGLSANTGFATYQWSSGQTTANISAQIDGNYIVTVTTAAGCTGTAMQIVSIPPPPMTNITGVSALCPGISGQLSAAGGYSNYVWSGGLTGANITAAAPGTYTVTATDQFGCTATAQRVVNASPPLVPVVGGPLEICIGGTALIAVNGTFDNYKWSTGATTSGISASTTGNYTVTVTNADGCSGTATHPLLVGTGLSPQITAAPYLCNGQINLSAGAGFSTYVWTNNAGTSGITVTTSGNYAVTVTDNTGCTGTALLNVTIPTPPGVSIGGNTDLCAGQTTQLSATPGYVTYAWSSGQNTPTITAGANGAFAVTVTDNFGCTAFASIGVTIYPPIMPAIVGPAAICQNANATLSVNSNFAQYLWSNGLTTPTISVLQSGSYLVTVTDLIGCTAIAAHGLTVNPAPQPVLQQNIYDCDGQIDLTASSGFSNYSWSTGSATAAAVATVSGNYVVTVADAIGCTGTETIAVVIPADPVVTIATAQPFCLGGSGQLQASGSFSNYIWSSGQATTGITVNLAGNYSVTVTDQFGCTATSTTAVAVLPLPQPVVQGPPEMCAGASFPLSVNGGIFTQFSWSDGSTGATTNISFPGNYTVTVTDQNGCKNSDNITVATGTLPTATVGPDQTLTCVQNAVQLTGAGSSAGANFSYLWVASNGTTIQDGTTLTPVVTTAGTYKLVVTNSANGCTSSASVTVDQSADVPMVVLALPEVLTCTKISIQLDGTGSSGGAGFQYLWTATGTGNIVSGNTTLIPTIDNPGTYTLQVLNTTNNCSATSTIVILENIESPVLNVGPIETLTCTQPFLNIQAIIVSSSSQNLDYAWTTVGGNIQSGATKPNPIVNAPGTYTVVATDLTNGCTGSATKQINVDANLPVATVALPQILTCVKISLNLDGSASSFGANFKYTWKTQDGNIVNQFDPQKPLVDQPGEYTLIVQNTANGCADTTLVEVFQDVEAPTAEAGATKELSCKTLSLQLLGTASGASSNLTFDWSTAGTGNIVSGKTTLTPTIDNPGTYILVVTDASNGCTKTDNVVISENVSPPVLSISTPGLLTCVDQTASISTNLTGQGNAPTLVWATSNGNITSPVDQKNITVDKPGTYIFLVTNNENGCTATIQTIVNQNIAPPPVVIENPLLLTCSRTEVDLQANFTNNLTAVWTTLDGTILSGENTATPSVGQIGTYQVLVTNPADGCTNTAEISVGEETDKPHGITFRLSEPDCTGKKGVVDVDSVLGGVQPIIYSINGGQSFLSAKHFGGLAPGNYDLVIQDANGCEHTQSLNVPIPVKPAVQLPPVFEIEFGDSLQLQPNFPPGFSVDMVDTAFWKPLDDLVFESLTMPELLTPWAKPFKTATYTLTIVTQEGCTAEARSQIKVTPPNIYVPNIIRPDGADIEDNAGFTIFANTKAVVEIQRLQIFDRWGEQVFVNTNFQPNDPSIGWKGTFRKKQNTPAVFVWYAEVLLRNGEIEFLEGDVTVYR